MPGTIEPVKHSLKAVARVRIPLGLHPYTPRFLALLTDPWVESAGQDRSVAAEAEHCECDEGVR